MKQLAFSTKIYAGTFGITIISILLLSGIIFIRMTDALVSFSEDSLTAMVQRVYDTLELQNDITQAKIDSDLALMNQEIMSIGEFSLDQETSIQSAIQNQVTKATEQVTIPMLKIGNMNINNNFSLVDKVQKLAGGTATIFQVLPGKLLRVSTNVKKLDGKRAVGTYIPSSSPVYETVMSGKTFKGKAYVVNAWYLTAYKPVRDATGEIVAVIYVGRKIMTPQLSDMLAKININGKGKLFVSNSKGEILYHADSGMRDKKLTDFPFGRQVLESKDGIIKYEYNGVQMVAGVQYYPPWDWHFGLALPQSSLLFGMDSVLLSSIALSAGIALLLAILLAILLAKNMHKIMLKVANACHEISRGHYDVHIDYTADDALGKTVCAVHDLAQTIYDKVFIMESFRAGVSLPLFSVDGERTVQFVNDALCTLTGQKAEKVVGKMKGFELLNYPSVDVCEVCKPIAEIVVPEKRAWEGEVKFKHLSGEQKETLVSAFPIKDRNGEILEIAIMLQDITEIKRFQKVMSEQTEILRETAQAISEITDRMATSTGEVAAQIDETAKGAESQKQRTDVASTAMEQMNFAVIEVAKNASNAADSAESAKAHAVEGSEIVQESIQAIESVHYLITQLKENMRQLGAKSESIGQVLNVITDIADQTNLLALNAAIEAARAGEQGRGFAVVADEVRKLAEKTMAATSEVGNAILSIQKDTQKNIEDTNQATRAVEHSTELAANSGKALQEIVSIVEVNADQVRTIATAAEEQSASSEAIATTVEDINSISAKTSEGMLQASEAMLKLAQQAEKLKELVKEMNASC